LSACAGSTAPGASSSTDSSSLSGTSITVYNAQHEELTQAWADAFTKKTGIEVVLRNGSDSELGNQIVQEGSASPADVFLTENSPAMSPSRTRVCSPRSTPRRWQTSPRSTAPRVAIGQGSQHGRR
jgi:ABC-type molybdate transport system substrate-binding protein